MSWSASAAAKGAVASQAISKQLEYAKQNQSEPTKEMLAAIETVVAKFAEQLPNHVLVVKTSGHVDRSYGNLRLEIESYQVSEE